VSDRPCEAKRGTAKENENDKEQDRGEKTVEIDKSFDLSSWCSPNSSLLSYRIY
jgi:hypothetical protein